MFVFVKVNRYFRETLKTNKMESILLFSKLIIAVSILIVWCLRFDNIEKEFKQYGLSVMVRSFVGAAKISMATLLVASIWYEELVLVPAAIMGFLMLSAQYFHFKVKNPFVKFLPSLGLLILSLLLVSSQL